MKIIEVILIYNKMVIVYSTAAFNNLILYQQ